MLGQYLITFREFFEASLITSIVLGYLRRTGRIYLSRYIWIGAFSAILLSVIGGVYGWLTYGTLSENSKALFEALTAFLAVIVLTTMVYWMAIRGKELKKEVEKKVENIAIHGATLGLTAFAFIIVFREGVETVLFLMPFLVRETGATVAGIVLGILSGLLLSYGIFIIGMKINLKKFFHFTSILLVLLAGGLAGYGVHELIEYTGSGNFGWLGSPAYNLNIAKNNPLHHKGIIGSILAVTLGYSVSAEWGRVIVHILYLSITLPLVIRVYRRN